MMPKILIVDDSQIACAIMRLELLPFGYQVIAAETVDEAFERLEADPELHTVLLDMSVAELLGGREVLTRLRERHPSKYLPVILHSAIEQEELRQCAEEFGADGVHRKGGRLLDLVDQLGLLCSSPRPSQAS